MGKILLSIVSLGMISAASATAVPGATPASVIPTSVISVAPLLIDVDARSSNASLRLTNGSDRPMPVEMTVYRWDQSDGHDRLVETDAVAISPAITRIPARGQQVVRVLFLGSAAAVPSAEQSYRVIIEELPDAAVASDGPQMRLRLSIPLFRNSDDTRPPLAASLDDGDLVVTNRGGRRVRLIEPRLQTGDGASVGLTSSGPAYVLAGQGRRFQVAGMRRCLAAGARLIAASDMGPVDVAVADCSG